MTRAAQKRSATGPSRPGILISTKLVRPPARPGWVARPRLIERLDEALDQRLTLVSAPAGFGKSVLVAQWLEKRGRPVAWLSLDPFDGEPEPFVRYLVAAIGGASAVRLTQTGALLAARQPPPFRYLCDVLASELARVEEPLVVVLEDYHSVASADVHQLLERLVPLLSPALRVVVLTRRDPPWPLGHWRAQGWLLELRGRDLRFTPDEARSFFAAGRAVSLTDSTVETLVGRAEGWIAGLRLMKLSLREAEDPEERARALSGTDRLIVDYLATEVLFAQPPEVREFLAVTAPLARFCASLADHLLGEGSPRPPAQETLTRLELDNMFLVPLDDEGRWYRYHHLFRDLLLHHLPELAHGKPRAEVHRRAGEWFAREGLIEEALRSLIEAGELDAAARLLGENVRSAIDADQSRRVLSRWLSLFPPGAERGRLPLLVAHGYMKTVTWDFPGLAGLVAEADALLRTSAPGRDRGRLTVFRADIEAQRSFLLYWTGDAAGALKAASAALKDLAPRTGGIARAMATVYRAGGLAMAGRKDEALRALQDAATEAATTPGERVGDYLLARTIVHLYAAEMDAVDAMALRLQAADETAPIGDYLTAYVHYFRAAVSYERNDLEQAGAGFQRVEAMRYRTATRLYQDALIGLGLVALARADAAGAGRHAAAARAFALEVGDTTSLRIAESLDLRLALKAGERAPLASPPAAPDFMSFWLEVPSVTWAERLLDDMSPGGPDVALAYVDRVLEEAEAHQNVHLAIPFTLLRAMALDRGGDRAAALAVLESTVGRAEPLGLVRTFVDRGPRLTALLEELAARVGRGGYVETLLSACRGIGARPGVAPSLESWDALTNRETQVLELLAERLTNKEIAERLHISTETVKNHAIQVYGKLGVHGRRQAVAKALADGLIAPRAWPPAAG